MTGQRLHTIPNEESAELRWVPFDQVEALELIPPFREALPQLVARYGELSS